MTDEPKHVINAQCGRCGGSGLIERHYAAIHRDLPGRMGSGAIPSSCPACKGTGWIPINA